MYHNFDGLEIWVPIIETHLPTKKMMLTTHVPWFVLNLIMRASVTGRTFFPVIGIA